MPTLSVVEKFMPETSKPTKTADEIAEMAARGEDVSAYFTNDFMVVRPAREVLQQLDSMAALSKGSE